MTTNEIRDTDTETLRHWLRNNERLIVDEEYDPHIERTQLHRCQMHIRDIRAELVSREKDHFNYCRDS